MTGNRACITSFFNSLGIAGIRFDDSGETRFLTGNARTSVTVTSIHRERIIPRTRRTR